MSLLPIPRVGSAPIAVRLFPISCPWLLLLSGLFLAMFGASPGLAAECVDFTKASQHVGHNRCITGKVWDVKDGSNGVTFLDFCEDFRICPFTVVIFPRDLRDVGDVRQLKGRTIEIHGPVTLYDDRAEIILRDYKQLGGEAARIPPLPKGYDVEKKGRYSAGKLTHPKGNRRPARKRQGANVDVFQPESSAEPE